MRPPQNNVNLVPVAIYTWAHGMDDAVSNAEKRREGDCGATLPPKQAKPTEWT